MKNFLFIIPTLGHGGAEKVLVNTVNNLDTTKYDITVLTLYDEGINKQFLNKNIHYKYWLKRSFKGVGHLLKLFTPKQLYKMVVKDDYDIVISFLEGQSARIVSGCNNPNTKIYCWIHRTYTNIDDVSRMFRNSQEAINCYSNFDDIIYVSEDVQKSFLNTLPLVKSGRVLYNVNDTDSILSRSKESLDYSFDSNTINLFGMGTLFEVKGFDRLIRVHKRLIDDGLNIHTYILGEGKDKDKLLNMIKELDMSSSFTLLGYQSNPYKYLSHADLFVCSSHSEGFSTAVTEALVLGIPVVTTDVSGMHELLGNSEYGVICDNNEEALYESLKDILINNKLNYYKDKAIERGKYFSMENTIKELEELLDEE